MKYFILTLALLSFAGCSGGDDDEPATTREAPPEIEAEPVLVTCYPDGVPG